MTLFTSIDNLLSLSPVRRALKNNNLLPQSAIRKCCSHFDRLIPDWIQWPLDGFGLFLLTSSRVSFWDQLDLLKTIKIKPVVSSHLHIRVAQSIRIHRNKVTGLQQLKEFIFICFVELKYPLLYRILISPLLKEVSLPPLFQSQYVSWKYHHGLGLLVLVSQL